MTATVSPGSANAAVQAEPAGDQLLYLALRDRATDAPAGVSSVSDSSSQSLSGERVPSGRWAATTSPVTNGDRGYVQVNQLLVSTSMNGAGSGTNP